MKDIVMAEEVNRELNNPLILKWINDFASRAGDSVEMYANGYCYHFAHILKSMFKGEVMWILGRGHMVFMSEDLVPYDVHGVYPVDIEKAFVNVSLLTKNTIEDFSHACTEEHSFEEDLKTLANVNEIKPGIASEFVQSILEHIPEYVDDVKEYMHTDNVNPELVLLYVSMKKG